MKRLLSLLLCLLLLCFAPASAFASGPWYRFLPIQPFAVDDVQETDPAFSYTAPEGCSAEILRVKPDWALVNRETVLWQIVSCHKGVYWLEDVLLTDCVKTVHADIRATGYATAEITFLTRDLRGFDTSHGVYMIFVYKDN